VRQKNIPGLDAMRVSAITLVILYHMRFPVSSALGVITSFVLSGFLITFLLLKEIKRSGTISIRRFYGRRAYRIFPAFYVCWFVTMGIALWQHQPVTRANALETFFYLADYGRAFLTLKQQYAYQMGISWSLAAEEQFYFLWPMALLYLYKLKQPARAVATIIVGLWLWRALVILGFHVSWDYAYNAFETRADALMIGCWLALILFRDQDVPRPLQFWLRSRWLVLVPIVALVVVSIADTRQVIGAATQVLAFTVDPVLIAILLLQWMYWGSTDWPLLEHWSIKFVARLSYSVYLYHLVVLSLIPHSKRFLPIAHMETAVRLVFFLLIASVSYYGIERPFMRIRDRGRRASALMDDGLHPL
jgi:peptidoglycan/LPS O-acetylase OafA/YrhL